MSSEDSPDNGIHGTPEARPDDTADAATPGLRGGGDEEPTAEGQEDGGEATAEPSLEEQLGEAQAAAKANREKMLRVAADFENFRKRSQREVDDAHRRGMQTVVKDLLTVFDNIERATNVTDETSVDSMAEGLRMVQRQFLDLIGKRGIERVEALGQPFDPNLHEAIQYDVSDQYDAGSVMLVLQAGYKMGDQLLRPALVMVSRGKAEPAAEAGDGDHGAAADPPTDEDPGAA